MFVILMLVPVLSVLVIREHRDCTIGACVCVCVDIYDFNYNSNNNSN